MRRSEKSEYVSKLKEELNNSSTVVVAHYKGLNVSESEELRKKIIFEWAYPEVAEWCKIKGREYPELNANGEILEDLPRSEKLHC